jgi:endonuclease III
MNKNKIVEIVSVLKKETTGFTKPLIQQLNKEFGHNTFIILIGCLLSLRARDTMTIIVSMDLFKRAKTPEELLKIEINELEQIIKSIGFYKNKAETIQNVSRELLSRFNGKVPATKDELLSIKGVGLKTANLVLGLGFGIPAICVDIHVHRISNRLGLIKTETPEQTESELRRIIPIEFWILYNELIVMWGQNICQPVSPRCSTCAISGICTRSGVKKSR